MTKPPKYWTTRCGQAALLGTLALLVSTACGARCGHRTAEAYTVDRDITVEDLESSEAQSALDEGDISTACLRLCVHFVNVDDDREVRAPDVCRLRMTLETHGSSTGGAASDLVVATLHCEGDSIVECWPDE